MNWYRNNAAEWKEIIETVARELGRTELMVEKDTINQCFYWNYQNRNCLWSLKEERRCQRHII